MQIKAQIISGKLGAGDLLPSIRSLAKDLRISVIPTKRAYDGQANWESLAVMMPYSRKSRILSKFLPGYLSMAGAGVPFAAVELIPVLAVPAALALNGASIFLCLHMKKSRV